MAEIPLAKIGILSMGDMGSGFARLLAAEGFAVYTNCSGRSQDTVDRAINAGATMLPDDVALVRECDIIMSIVPPRDAIATGQRVVDALVAVAAVAPTTTTTTGSSSSSTTTKKKAPLCFMELNAVSPATARATAALFATAALGPDAVRFVDGSILSEPPVWKPGGGGDGHGQEAEAGEWRRPRTPLSGPHTLAALFPAFGARLADVLRAPHVSADVGAASGLKMCFAAMHKGYAAVAVQAVTAARRLGVLAALLEMAGYEWGRVAPLGRAVTVMPPKAYRWVREMEEIAATFADGGHGFAGRGDIFTGAAETFRIVAHETVLGREKTEARVRGTTPEDVALAMEEGMVAARGGSGLGGEEKEEKEGRLGLEKKGWTPEEDSSVMELRADDAMRWEDVATRLPGRNADECRLRYRNLVMRWRAHVAS